MPPPRWESRTTGPNLAIRPPPRSASLTHAAVVVAAAIEVVPDAIPVAVIDKDDPESSTKAPISRSASAVMKENGDEWSRKAPDALEVVVGKGDEWSRKTPVLTPAAVIPPPSPPPSPDAFAELVRPLSPQPTRPASRTDKRSSWLAVKQSKEFGGPVKMKEGKRASRGLRLSMTFPIAIGGWSGMTEVKVVEGMEKDDEEERTEEFMPTTPTEMRWDLVEG
ncbi:hypothetical protein HK101_004502 [Irineochytrium annulatum]|nr:hypothetical protein HK101_004502 [Irineochytrium annulatum]